MISPRGIAQPSECSSTRTLLAYRCKLIDTAAASTARGVTASLLPGYDEPPEEQNDQCKHEPGKHSVVDPGHIRQCKVGLHARSSKVQVDMDVPRHIDNEGQTCHAKPEDQKHQDTFGNVKWVCMRVPPRSRLIW